MQTTVILWAASIVVFAVVEGITAGLTSIWFAIGSIAALICAVMGGPIFLQIVWFVVISAAALILTRPLARKYINARTQPTNADRAIGETGVVTERIDNVAGTGAVKLDALVWTARSSDDTPIEAGERVIVREIRGVRLIVSREE